uniref:Uncharacterized protein n=1 Tax=Nelumbo nucifera TaxID=4432 RepID=A0A822YKS1_NELNU|nr:TPA_asm: hypothetical protein HUJ06_010357 [Nelumbo nucifera]
MDSDSNHYQTEKQTQIPSFIHCILKKIDQFRFHLHKFRGGVEKFSVFPIKWATITTETILVEEFFAPCALKQTTLAYQCSMGTILLEELVLIFFFHEYLNRKCFT